MTTANILFFSAAQGCQPKAVFLISVRAKASLIRKAVFLIVLSILSVILSLKRIRKSSTISIEESFAIRRPDLIRHIVPWSDSRSKENLKQRSPRISIIFIKWPEVRQLSSFTVFRNYCLDCGEKYTLDFILKSKGVPHCTKCGGIVRPDVVLYEEHLEHENIDKAVKAIKKADLLIIGGTSLTVYPAATFAQFLKSDRVVIINKSSTYLDLQAMLTIHDSIGAVLDEAISKYIPKKKPATTAKSTAKTKSTAKAKPAAKTATKAKTAAKAKPAAKPKATSKTKAKTVKKKDKT